jgi:hypothetical protein
VIFLPEEKSQKRNEKDQKKQQKFFNHKIGV